MKMIIWVIIGVLRRTVVGDRLLTNLCGHHLQSQVIAFSQLKNLGEQFDCSIDRVVTDKAVM